MRIFLIILLIYLVFRFLRNIVLYLLRSRPNKNDDIHEPEPTPRQTKLIPKDEGEYVDYEEVKK